MDWEFKISVMYDIAMVSLTLSQSIIVFQTDIVARVSSESRHSATTPTHWHSGADKLVAHFQTFCAKKKKKIVVKI